MICSDSQFLRWLHDRLVNVYKESPNADFMLRLDQIVGEVKGLEELIPDLKYIHAEIKGMTKDAKR